MAAEMPRWHKNLFHTISRDEFETAIDNLDREIPSLTRHQIIVAMARIAAMIGDGHTNIAPTRDPKIGFRTYPLKLYFFSDGLYVRSAIREHASLVGSRVTAIGNASVEKAYEAVRQIIGWDNEMGVRFFAPSLLVMPEVLHALDLISDMDAAPFTLETDGLLRTITVKPFGPAALLASHTDTSWTLGPNWIDARESATTPTPLWLKEPGNKYWYEYLPESRSLYVQFNHVENKDDDTVEEFSARLLRFVDDNQVDRFILDLRLNRGGNGELNLPLLLTIIRSRKIDQQGKLFTIIGRCTWSAAQFLADELEKYTNTLFVGEPTGGKLNSYGDSHRIILPNSGIAVRVSTLWWQEDERDTRVWTAPDITAEMSMDDYTANTDPALNAILAYVPGKSLTELLTESLSEGGLALAEKRYDEWTDDPSKKYADTEQELNQLGYELLGSDQTDNAIGILKLNVKTHPESANAHDSLGEAYMVAGKSELAIDHYGKSLKLNPKNAHAVEMLKRLGTK